MNKKNPKLVIGFILFKENTARYLPFFLPSLKSQDFSNLNIVAYINKYEKDDINEKYLKQYYPEIDIIKSEENKGFAFANNRMMKKAFDVRADYFLTINPDAILEDNAISEMIKVLDFDNNLASVSPKILKWDFENNKKTDIIDTCGIQMSSGLRFFDIGQGQKDNHLFYKQNIIGPSGACAMYRMRDVERVKEDDEYFDENMFMYKEDCDLAYKLFLLGFSSKLANNSIIYHDRTVENTSKGLFGVISNRRNKSKQVKIWSFQGQQIIFLKYWHLQDFWSKLSIILFEIKVLFFIALVEPYLLKEIVNLYKKRKDIRIYK